MTDASTNDQAVLEQRARLLARPLDDGAAGGLRGGAGRPFLAVHFGEERAAIALEHIIEVHRPGALTPIPGAQPPVVGVIAWRGRVLTVLDLAPARRERVTISDATRILIVGEQRASFGIIVDDVDDVRDVNMEDVLPVESADPGRRDFIRGALADAVVVLDAPALVARFTAGH